MAIFFIQLPMVIFSSMIGGYLDADEQAAWYAQVKAIRITHQKLRESLKEKLAHENLPAEATDHSDSDLPLHSALERSDKGKSTANRSASRRRSR